MKKFLLGLGILIILLVAILFFNTLTFKSKQVAYPALAVKELSSSAIGNMQKSIQIATISMENEDDIALRGQTFLDFQTYLSEAYPLADSLLNPEVINTYSLLYTWQGSDTNIPPMILMAHYDVVPVDEPTKDEWKAGAFSGAILEDAIWGRGSMDDKGNLISIMEAVEQLLQEGYQPKRTIYLAFGHDEELGGQAGAKFLAQVLQDRGVHAEFVLDEGGFVLDGMVPGINEPVAMIATAEKGFLTLELTVNTNGGHSSMPTRENAIGTLATAIHDLENEQFKYKMLPVTEDFIDYLGPEMPTMQKIIFANKWLFGGLILEGVNNHTTIAPTIFNSGVKDNVLPTRAVAKVNFRILPGETTDEVIAHVVKTINNDRVNVKTITAMNPSGISDADTEPFRALAKTITEVLPGAVVAPGLTPGGTDTKHYKEVADYFYRFSPMMFKIGGDGPHSVNEHLNLVDYRNTINFYYRFIENIDNEQ